LITIATLLWEPNGSSYPFSRMYDESWVWRLLKGFERNLSLPFRFVLFTDRQRHLPREVAQIRMLADAPSYADCIEPYQLNEPMILCGLDTVVTGPVNHLAQYCLDADKIALPRDPNQPEIACNGVALVPAGQKAVFEEWSGENDMAWLRARPHAFIDDIFPGQVVSYKGHVKKNGLGIPSAC
jgi:hypothetical protein